MRVFHCPHLVGNNAGQLARAERKLGLDSRLVVFQQNYLNYPADEVLLDSSAGILRWELARWKMLWRAIPYDVIHYNFGQSMMPSRLAARGKLAQGYPWFIRMIFRLYVACFEFFDVRLLKWLGKGIVVTYQGDDARQGDYCRKHFEITFANEVGDGYYNDLSDRLKRERISIFAKYADYIYALNPDLLHVLPEKAKFLPYTSVDPNDWVPTHARNSKPVVLHAPSQREVKGTRFILDAVERLHADGIPFDFVLVEGMSNQEARVQYEKADLLVDQLLAGWYGGLAVELMALGKPVMAYLRGEDLARIPAEMRLDLPIVQVTPDSIYGVLRHWLTNGRDELESRGRKSRTFVEKWHDPAVVAATLRRDYEMALQRKHRR